MMTEIGLAQKRLMDDDPSTAGQQLLSTATRFSMESSSLPFPAESSPHSQLVQLESNNFAYTEPLNETYNNANQSLLSSRQSVYDLTSNTSSSMISPPKSFPQDVAEFPRFKERQNLTSIPTQIIAHSNGYQPEFCSPHDTEPNSSVVSARLNEVKTDTAGTSLMSPQHSQTSAPDELSLPAAPVPAVVPITKKKPGHPRKGAIPDSDDEDDELAFPRGPEFQQPSANGAIYPSERKDDTEPNTPAPGEVSDETNEGILANVVKPGKSEPKEPKKKKLKKEKPAPAPQPSSGKDDDEMIWVNTKPLDGEPVREESNPETVAMDSNPPKDLKAAQNTAREDTPQSIQGTDKLAPKKRGRKRKTPADQTPADSPAPKVSVVVNTSPNTVSPSNDDSNTQPEIQEQGQQDDEDPQPQPEPQADPEPNPNTTEAPHTPSKSVSNPVETPQNQKENAGKAPSKHSPISARSAVPLRVGLSKRARIAPLLKMVRK
jgi:hypothetical protein